MNGAAIIVITYEKVDTEFGPFIKATEDQSKISVLARTEDKALKLLLIKLADVIDLEPSVDLVLDGT